MPPDPDSVRDQLFTAIANDDAAEFGRLMNEHEQLVLRCAVSWATIPESHREPREALHWYARGLITLAQQLAQHGHTELWERVQPASPEQDPLAHWQNALQRIDRHCTEGRFREGATEARELLERVKGLRGTGPDQLLPLTLGRLGESLFHLGETQAARGPFEEALRLCGANQDFAGVAAYLGSLSALEGYLGNAAEAAKLLDSSASVLEQLGQTAQAGARRRTAERMRAGEPLCRVVVELDGREYELDEVPVFATSHFKFNFRRNRRELGAATVLVQAGVAEARAGNHAPALRCFEEAARIDPHDPWPHFHTGTVLCFEGRYADAIAALTRTETLAPGFFHVRTDLWFAQQLAAGKLTQQSFRVVRYLLDNEPEPREAARLAIEALQTSPLALLHLLAGDALHKLGERRNAETQYRLGLEAAEEPDVKTRLLVSLSMVIEDRTEARQLLRDAIQLRGNLTAAAMAELVLRAGQHDA